MTRIRSSWVSGCALALLVSFPGPGTAQWIRAPLLPDQESYLPPLANEASSVRLPARAAGTPRLVLGGMLGQAAGVMAGVAAAMVMADLACDDGPLADWYGRCADDEILLFGLLGIAAGTSLGTPVGVHLANRRKGSLWAGLLASCAATAAGFVVGKRVEESAFPAVAAGVGLAQIAGSILAERATTRDE